MLALIADVHSNLEALTACLDHARLQGAQSYAFLGDLVGYNADPAAVVDRVRSLVEEGAAAVGGNHDAAVGGAAESMNQAAMTAIEWTRRQLRPDQAAFLAGLPLTLRRGDVLFVHASAAAPERWNYVRSGLQAAASLDAAGSRYVFGGHVHEQVLYFLAADGRPEAFAPTPGVPIPVPRHRRWLALAGSAGQPRGGSPAACYALFDEARCLLTFQRVPYDHQAAAAKVRAAGLPEELAARLETGR